MSKIGIEAELAEVLDCTRECLEAKDASIAALEKCIEARDAYIGFLDKFVPSNNRQREYCDAILRADEEAGRT